MGEKWIQKKKNPYVILVYTTYENRNRRDIIVNTRSKNIFIPHVERRSWEEKGRGGRREVGSGEGEELGVRWHARARCGRRLYQTWPRAWYRQRCAKNDGLSALLTARSLTCARENSAERVFVACNATRRAVRRRDATRRAVVPRLIAMALVTVQRSPSVSSSPQSSVSFVRLFPRYTWTWISRVVYARNNDRAVPRERDCYIAAPTLVRFSLARLPRTWSLERRPAALPYLAVLWQPKREWELEVSLHVPVFTYARSYLWRRARRAILSIDAESAPKQRDSRRKQT